VLVENVTTATFKCVFPVCGGICCKNGRPCLETYQVEKIEANLGKFLPHLRPAARKHVEKNGWLTHRTKDGYRMIGVEGGWCLFANEGCVFQKVGMLEGTPGPTSRSIASSSHWPSGTGSGSCGSGASKTRSGTSSVMLLLWGRTNTRMLLLWGRTNTRD